MISNEYFHEKYENINKSKTEAEIFSSNKVLQLSNIKVSLSVINGGRCASVWVI